jgi:hypothetical protein
MVWKPGRKAIPMAHITLTQAEADALIAMEKRLVDAAKIDYPKPGSRLAISLVSSDKKEDFVLDVNRNRLDLSKVTHQNRARQVIVPLRLDLGAAPHRNPNGEELAGPHLHVYREGYGEKWAFPVPSDKYRDIANLLVTLEDFMRHCNVVQLPEIQIGLF